MQVVILAAGLGTRMGELTKKTPKSLLPVAGKTILEHKFDALPPEIDEIVLIVGYLQEQIRERYGSSYNGRKITYVDCPDPVGGTMYATERAKPILRGEFIVTNGDDIHLQKDIQKCLEREWAMAVIKREDMGAASSVQIDSSGVITEVLEASSHGGGPGLAGVGLYMMDLRIFAVEPVQLPGRSETGLPQTMVAAAKKIGIPLMPVEISFVLHISKPDDLWRAEAILTRL